MPNRDTNPGAFVWINVRRTAIVILAIGSAWLLLGPRKTIYIASGSRTTLWQRIPMLSVHLGPQNYLCLGGRRFTGVQGETPFFVPVRGSNLIAFVTVEKNGRILRIACPRTAMVVVEAPLTSYFGNWIGRTSLAPLEYDEAVLLPSREQIMLIHSTTDGARESVVDLPSKAVISELDKSKTAN